MKPKAGMILRAGRLAAASNGVGWGCVEFGDLLRIDKVNVNSMILSALIRDTYGERMSFMSTDLDKYSGEDSYFIPL